MTRAFSSAAASEGRRLKAWGDAAPRTIRWGSPTPAMTALTSECTGLIEATIRSAASAAGPAMAQPVSTAVASA